LGLIKTLHGSGFIANAIGSDRMIQRQIFP